MKSHGSGISVNINAQGGHGHHCPPDHDVLRVLDLATRDAIPPQHRHEGMWVLVLEDMTFYRLTGGLTNDCWVVCGGGHGGEISPDDLPIASKTEKGIVQIGENISVDAAGLIAVAKASEDVAGVVELASVAEAKAGTDTTKAVTPAGLAEALVQDKVDHPLPIASKTEKGVVQIGENISVDADGLIAVAKASADTIGVVKGGDNVAIAADGTLSVPKLTEAEKRGQVSVNSPGLGAGTTPPNDANILTENGAYTLNQSGALNTPNAGYAWTIIVTGKADYKHQFALSLSSTGAIQIATRYMWGGVWGEWRMLAGDLGVEQRHSSGGKVKYAPSPDGALINVTSYRKTPGIYIDGDDVVPGSANFLSISLGRYTNVSTGTYLQIYKADGTSAQTASVRPGGVYFPVAGTTASAANAYLSGGTGDTSNALLRSTSSLAHKTDIEPVDPDLIRTFLTGAKGIWYRSLAEHDKTYFVTDGKPWGWFGFGAEDLDALGLKQLVQYVPHPDDYEDVIVSPERTEKNEETGEETIIPAETERRPQENHRWVPNGVAYDRITVLLTAIVQEQAGELAVLKDKMADIEARLAQMEGLI